MIAECYRLNHPCDFVRVEYFKPRHNTQRNRWEKTEISTLCFQNGWDPLLLSRPQCKTHYHYQGRLLQKKVTLSSQHQVLQETHYSYDDRDRLTAERAVRPGEEEATARFFYTNLGQLAEKRIGCRSFRYRYNQQGELTLQQDYQQGRLTRIHRKGYQKGLLVSHDEILPNQQLHRRHLYSRNAEGEVVKYWLQSGQKLLLKHLVFVYPCSYQGDWLERIVVQFHRRPEGWEGIPLKRVRRSCCYPVNAAGESLEDMPRTAHLRLAVQTIAEN